MDAEKALLVARLEQIKEALRFARIKLNTDYAFTVKYGKVHVLCGAVYEDLIRETFGEYSVPIETLHTYN